MPYAYLRLVPRRLVGFVYAPACVLLMGVASTQSRAADKAVDVRLSVSPQTGELVLQWKDGSRIEGICSRIVLSDGSAFVTNEYTTHNVIGSLDGGSVTIRHTATGRPTIIQRVWRKPGEPWVEIQAEVDGAAAAKGTRHFSAVTFDRAPYLPIEGPHNLQVLHMPYDNDMWFRFNSVALGAGTRDIDSSEATAIYDNDSRRGFVLGSVVHNQWKTSIAIRSHDGNIASADVFGGIQGTLGERSATHDFVDHGIVRGGKVLSPRIMVGEFADWREGLEAFGRRNAEFQPPLHWPGPRPLGWNSWAAYADKINEKRYISAAKFVHEDLVPLGFSRPEVYVNFDAFWSNLDGVALLDAAHTVAALPVTHGTRVLPGIYWTPFAAWTDDLDTYVEGTDGRYRYRDILLKGADGQPLPKVDRGRAIDPTHPGTRMRTRFYVDALVKMGFKFIKLDFLSHGALEGAHYDQTVQTGTEAYNEGMRDLVRDNAGRMYLSLSIAPLFPSGYGNSRRLSCDTKGHINGRDQSTEYMLNALTYGWWTDKSLYTIDPDHVVLGDKADQGSRNYDEAKSRLLSAIIAGGMIVDSSRLADDPEGQALAKKVYSIRPWMEVAALGKSFRPLDGGTGDNATAVFYCTKVGGYYVALFNYDDKNPQTMSIPLARIDAGLRGLTARFVDSGEPVPLQDSRLVVTLSPSQSQLIEVNSHSGDKRP